MNYATEQRLRFIECMLAYYGRIGRTELMDFFGVSGATATALLDNYSSKFPENIVLDPSSKNYLQGYSFKRHYE